jgi:hypothetical protein
MEQISENILTQLPKGKWEVTSVKDEPHLGIYVKVYNGKVQPMPGSLAAEHNSGEPSV